MLSDDIEAVDKAWGEIGMSRPQYLAWCRIKTALAEAQKPSPNSVRDAIALLRHAAQSVDVPDCSYEAFDNYLYGLERQHP